MLTLQHTQECLSLAFIGALAGRAGVNLSVSRTHDYGVDGTLLHVEMRGTRRIESGFHVDFQLKSTKNWSYENGQVIYDLEAKTFNDLVGRDPAAVKCILVLLCLPSEESNWLDSSEEKMLLRNCCYWAHLQGPQTEAEQRKRIRIPRANLLTAEALRDILVDERERLRNHDG